MMVQLWFIRKLCWTWIVRYCLFFSTHTGAGTTRSTLMPNQTTEPMKTA